MKCIVQNIHIRHPRVGTITKVKASIVVCSMFKKNKHSCLFFLILDYIYKPKKQKHNMRNKDIELIKD